jgi:hypothetical protein
MDRVDARERSLERQVHSALQYFGFAEFAERPDDAQWLSQRLEHEFTE